MPLWLKVDLAVSYHIANNSMEESSRYKFANFGSTVSEFS